MPAKNNNLLSARDAFFTFTERSALFADYVHRIAPGELADWVTIAADRIAKPRKPITLPAVDVRVAGPSIYIRHDTISVLCDPGYAVSSVLAPPDRVDVLLVTHAHADHVDALSRVLDDKAPSMIVMSRVTYELVCDQLQRAGSYNIIECLRTNWVAAISGQQLDAGRVKITAFDAGHCFGAVSYSLQYPDDTGTILIAGEFTKRAVGGCFSAIPAMDDVSLLFMDGTHADDCTLPCGVSAVNHQSVQDAVSKAYREKKTIVFACGSLGELQETYAACAAMQRCGMAAEYPLVIGGTRDAIRRTVKDYGHVPPWDVDVNYSDDLVEKAINVMSCAFDKDHTGVFWQMHRRQAGIGDMAAYFPNRYSEQCPAECSLYEAYTHASISELLELALVQTPRCVCLYAHGGKGSRLAAMIEAAGYQCQDVCGGSSTFRL